MFLWTARKISRGVMKFFAHSTTARRLALGIALGMVLGLIPKGNLTAAGVLLVIFAAHVNLGTALLSAVVFTLVGASLDQASGAIGSGLLAAPPLRSFWNSFFSTPLIPWTALNNTVVLGGLVLGAMLFYPVYRISLMLLWRLGWHSDPHPSDTVPVEAARDAASHAADANLAAAAIAASSQASPRPDAGRERSSAQPDGGERKPVVAVRVDGSHSLGPATARPAAARGDESGSTVPAQGNAPPQRDRGAAGKRVAAATPQAQSAGSGSSARASQPATAETSAGNASSEPAIRIDPPEGEKHAAASRTSQSTPPADKTPEAETAAVPATTEQSPPDTLGRLPFRFPRISVNEAENGPNPSKVSQAFYRKG